MARTLIPFLSDYPVKPNSINGLGIVTFTDGTNDITPNNSNVKLTDILMMNQQELVKHLCTIAI